MTRREVVNGWKHRVDRSLDLHIRMKLDLSIEVHRTGCTMMNSS